MTRPWGACRFSEGRTDPAERVPFFCKYGLFRCESRQRGYKGPKLWRMDRFRNLIFDDLPDGRLTPLSYEPSVAAR